MVNNSTNTSKTKGYIFLQIIEQKKEPRHADGIRVVVCDKHNILGLPFSTIGTPTVIYINIYIYIYNV